MTTTAAEDAPAEPAAHNQPDLPPVVGVGSSAGGIEALKSFVAGIPRDSGLAFVVVQHLGTDSVSVLAKILATVSTVGVSEIDNGAQIAADHVYVIPSNAALELRDNRLWLSPLPERRELRAPIDHFFQSLARARGESAACVILSGTGSDGTQGLRAIKEQGGLAVAQANAQYDGMMRSAVSTGLVDFIIPVEQIPAKINDYFHHATELQRRKGPQALQQEATDHLAQICSLLRARTGHDFTGYKDKTMSRRVQRRMQVLQIGEVPAFIARLREDPRQVDLLLQDMLIGVTSFFRDPAAFEALESKVIPHLFAGKGADESVRVWVPGCSTGEEAYSIAIMLREHIPPGQGAPRLQIFGSDIDEMSLQIARIGRYPATIARDMSPARLERYFIREDGTYRIASDLREMCLFASHNLLRDAPFSRLDLISCRNLLIYLTPELQNRLIPLFHYALQDSGYLFLGSSENVSRHARLFATVDKAHRIFQRRPLIERRLPEFPLTAPESQRIRREQATRTPSQRQTLQSLAERQILDRYAPAYVVINQEGELLQSSGRTGKYLEVPAGHPTADIFRMARRGLRADLRAAVHRASTTGHIALQSNITVGTNGGRQQINLAVQPLEASSAQDQLYLVVFQDIGGLKTDASEDLTHTVDDVESANLRQLEGELRSTKERLQMTTEELESSNEELKSGNEELSSMNEELQSANEELETSKEELQSINEELQTVNAELNARVEELSRANSDIANLLESTQIATVFLDRQLAIKSFTPAAKDLFHLVDSDMGRPLIHVRARFSFDTVQEDAARVLRTLAPIERQVTSTDNQARYIMRMVPYRTLENVIGGVVITFVDVSEITDAEARIRQLSNDLRNRVQNLETLLNLLPVGILLMEDARSEEVQVNRYGAQLLGEPTESSALQPMSMRLRLFEAERELSVGEQPLQRAARAGRAVAAFQGRVLQPDGHWVDVMVSATPLFDEAGKVRGSIATIVDISEHRRAQIHQQVLMHELQHRVKNIIATIGALASRMARDKQGPEEFAHAFRGRLNGMAATHDLLSQGNWAGAELRGLAMAALQAHVSSVGSNVTLDGPRIVLPPNKAAALGMVFYELATNAVKYGGLRDRQGSVAISWQITKGKPDDSITITWAERATPTIATPSGEGFGTGFVKRIVEYELDGKAEMEFNPAGLRWTLTLSVPRDATDPLVGAPSHGN